MGLTFRLVTPRTVCRLLKTHRFAGMSLQVNSKGEKFYLGKFGIDWPEPRIDPRDMRPILQSVLGPSNQFLFDDDKTTFTYVFHCKVYRDVFYEIYDYRGFLSCGVGVPYTDFSIHMNKDKQYLINNGLQELINELVVMYNLLVPE
jgi:hypothetical protein